MQFKYQEEEDRRNPFLHLQLVRKYNTFEKTVYRKPTNNGIYLNWNALAAKIWKRGELRPIITTKVNDVCCND